MSAKTFADTGVELDPNLENLAVELTDAAAYQVALALFGVHVRDRRLGPGLAFLQFRDLAVFIQSLTKKE